MTGRRVLALVSVAALLLPVCLASAAPEGQGGAVSSRARGPRIKSGLYGGGDVYLEVDVKKRKVAFHFTLLCAEVFGSQYVTSGPTPVRGQLSGNRRGATAIVDGEYEGPAASGPGTQIAFWGMRGKFTGPTHFEGRVEYEAATSTGPVPPAGGPPVARPQCIDSERIHLDRQPPGATE
jgi:hypothetical protein